MRGMGTLEARGECYTGDRRPSQRDAFSAKVMAGDTGWEGPQVGSTVEIGATGVGAVRVVVLYETVQVSLGGHQGIGDGPHRVATYRDGR